MKCLIIDDEPMARKGMKRLVETRPELELEEIFDSADKACAWLAGHTADLIFLDIEMPGMSGIELARRLPGECMVVFTTAYPEYAPEGFDVDALDYLVKPIDPARFNKAVDRAIAYKALVGEEQAGADEPDLEYIIVKADRRYVRVRLQEIMYVEALKDYVIIHLPDRRIVTRMTVKAMEDMLPRRQFVRVSKSYIVNKAYVDSFDNNDVFVGDTEIAIGLAYRDSVLDALLR